MSLVSGYNMKAASSATSLPRSRRSVDQVLSNFSMQTRTNRMLNEELQDAFDPNSKAIKVWEQVLLFCLLYEAFVLPYYLAFDVEGAFSMSITGIFGLLCESIFLLDFYTQAHTGYYSDGNVVRDRKKTRWRYVRSFQFVLDFVAMLPLTSALPESDSSTKILVGHLKLLRCSRLPHFVSSLDEFYAKHFVALKLLKAVVSSVYMAHVFSCVRFTFGYDENNSNHWLPKPPGHELSVHEEYLMSFFWSFGLLTGLFEGELPYTETQFLFTILVALGGFSMFTTLCATIFVISKCQSGQTEAVEARINQLIHLLSFHRVPESQQVPAIEYLRRYYTDAESNDREAVKLLCPSIATDIQVELHKKTMARIAIFAGCSDQFLVALTSLLEMIAVPAHTTLFSTGDEGDAMYVVHSGVLAIIVQGVTVREIRKGACFGELSVFSSLPRTATVVSTTYTTLYRLSQFHCARVLGGYPACAAIIASHVNKLLNEMNINEGFGHRGSIPTIPRGFGSSFSNLSNSISKTGGRVSGSVSAGILAGTSAISSTLTRVLSSSSDPSKSSRSSRSSRASRRSIADMPWSRKKSVVLPIHAHIPEGAAENDHNDNSASHADSMAQSSTDINTTRVTTFSAGTPTPSRRESNPGRVTASFKKVQHLVHYYDRHQGGQAKTNSTDLKSSVQGNRPRLQFIHECIDEHSRVRKWWLVLLILNLWYCWTVIPMQLAFPVWRHPTWLARTADALSDIFLLVDVVLNFRLSFTHNSEKILDRKRCAQRYLKRGFLFDLLCALPYEFISTASYGLLRTPRLARIVYLGSHLNELEKFFQFNSRRWLLLLGVLLVIMFHVIACAHFGITFWEGFSTEEDSWIPAIDICLRRVNATHLENCNGEFLDMNESHNELQAISTVQYMRSLYYAASVLASLGKTVEPTSDVQYVAALVFMLNGFLITAIVVDNVQKRFTASAYEQKEFFATRTRIQLFLRRQNATLAIHHRVKSFLDFWWSSHRGAVIGELLADLPRPVRLDVLRSICRPVLQTLALLGGVRTVRDQLEEALVENFEFILYGQGEIVYRQGDYVTGMYFLLEGEVCVVSMGGTPRGVPLGGYFGTAVLTQQERGEGYSEHVSANSGCILLFVSREHLEVMETIFPALKTEMLVLEKRLLNNKLAKADLGAPKRIRRQTTAHILRAVFFGARSSRRTVYDPDSAMILVWETWLFVAMTIQWTLVMIQSCFPVHDDQQLLLAMLMAVLELSFLVDIYVRAHVGYYEYGNKIMDPKRIWRTYFHSHFFALDIAALLPLFMVNWGLPAYRRWNMLNVNKLLRLFKVPAQLNALETRYLKLTTELRLFKLLYYTFLLSHVFACVWFDFASKESAPTFGSSSSVDAARKTEFGADRWLPPTQLANGSISLQYTASLYWSFGLMSASSYTEFPKTTSQCIFSVITMTSGFFLFAYVIGNFSDIIELMSAESRAFNIKMGAVRHLLTHFQLPEALQEQLKTFFLFKRYHTITQEHILVRCLPPSLLTDIRLVHLKPMIEKVEFLSGMEGSITRMLVSQFTQVLVSRGEFVCKLGDKGSDMFFVFTGVLNVLLPFSMVQGGRDFEDDNDGSAGPNTGWNPKRAPKKRPVVPTARQSTRNLQLKKLNEISAGHYFGENGLFTNGRRNAYIQAHTSCILYKLSRESLELVFDRYPAWKEKVVRIANIHREQNRLARLSREEQRRGTDPRNGGMLSRMDIMNERAERMKEELQQDRLRRGASGRGGWVATTTPKVTHWLSRWVFKPTTKLVLTFVEGAEVQSTVHLFWLRFMVFCTMYMAILTPYRLSMDSLERTTPVAVVIKAVGLLCELAFMVDVWFSWSVRESTASMELYEQSLRDTYKKERLVWDVVAAIPAYRFLEDFGFSPGLQLLRCVKIANIVSYLDELNRRSVAYEAARFWHVCTLYMLAIYWAACAYLVVSMDAGFGAAWEAWLPAQELELVDSQQPSSKQLARRFLRALYYATTTFVKKGRNFAPETAALFTFSIALSFVGLVTMSFVIGELANLFISSIGLEVDFRKNHIAVELYLARLRVSERLKGRVHAFMTSLWSSHMGVNYEELLAEMPLAIRTACVLHASRQPVDWFVRKVVAPTCWDGPEELSQFTHALAGHLHFEGYPRDESVIVEGRMALAMYFVLKGHLQLESSSLSALKKPIGLRHGDYFGERGLLGCGISNFTVRTVRACDLLSLRSEALLKVVRAHAFSRLALAICERAFENLKSQRLVACSALDMELHWGGALLQVVRALRGQHKEALEAAVVAAVMADNGTAEDGEKTEEKVETSSHVSPLVFVATAEREGERPTDTSEGNDASRLEDPMSLDELEAGELPASLGKMLSVLLTARECFAAFSPLLQLAMPTDPLDWSATFRPTRVAGIAEEGGDLEANAAGLERGAWLSSRHLSGRRGRKQDDETEPTVGGQPSDRDGPDTDKTVTFTSFQRLDQEQHASDFSNDEDSATSPGDALRSRSSAFPALKYATMEPLGDGELDEVDEEEEKEEKGGKQQGAQQSELE